MMPALQAFYGETIGLSVPGAIVDMEPHRVVSRTVQDVAGTANGLGFTPTSTNNTLIPNAAFESTTLISGLAKVSLK